MGRICKYSGEPTPTQVCGVNLPTKNTAPIWYHNMCKLTDQDVKATAEVMIDMLIRAIVLNTNGQTNSKNTHTNVATWEDTTGGIDYDVAPNRKDKVTGDDCRRGTI